MSSKDYWIWYSVLKSLSNRFDLGPKRGQVGKLTTSVTLPHQYGPHRRIIVNYENSLLTHRFYVTILENVWFYLHFIFMNFYKYLQFDNVVIFNALLRKETILSTDMLKFDRKKIKMIRIRVNRFCLKHPVHTNKQAWKWNIINK